MKPDAEVIAGILKEWRMALHPDRLLTLSRFFANARPDLRKELAAELLKGTGCRLTVAQLEQP